jgi:hypothetical protein
MQVLPHLSNMPTLTHRANNIRNACTKSESLRFSQFSSSWLILSVYIIMSFDFPFVRLFLVRQFCCYPYIEHLIYIFVCSYSLKRHPAGFSIYIFINTTVTFIETSGHSVHMSWIFVSKRIFLRNIGHLTLIPCFVKCPIIKP